jgi:drug/metabolite transporter (DMT)-like permease
MVEVGLGAAAGIAASCLFSVGLLLQAGEVRALPAGRGLSVAALIALLRRPRWVLGGSVMLAGFAFHVGALTLAPLTVVQPALVFGLLVLFAAGARDVERVQRRDLLGIAAIALGVVGVTLTAPDRSAVAAGGLALALTLGAVGAVAVLPRALPGSNRLATAGAGAAYALTGITTKLLSDAATRGDGPEAAGWLGVTVGAAALALLDQTAALRREGATEVGVIIYVVPVVVPVLLAPALFGEGWAASPGGGTPLLVAVAVLCAGAGVLARSRRVLAAERGVALPGPPG